ncbi:MAG: SlyX family protein [Pseudomonadota bacterium]
MDPIEEKLAHLERLVDDLNAVVTRQDREIATLTARVTLLMEREAAREAEGGGAVFGEERPPHY